LVYYADWNWAEARRELQQSVRLDPHYSIAHHRLAMVHYVFNAYTEAEKELNLAYELNPYADAHAFTLAEVYLAARRYDDTIRVAELLLRTPVPQPYAHFLKFQAYRAKGNRAAAEQEAKLGAQLDHQRVWEAIVPLAEGRIADARQIAIKYGTDDTTWISIFAGLGERERMYSALSHLIANRNVIVLAIKDDPVFDAYRSEPEFQELINRLHLPAPQT
jgi:tetratricopeptide (TPR) repeat protein